MSEKYVLDEHGEPVAEPNLFKWARFMENEKCQVARECVGESTISTVFLGLNHAYGADKPPVLWETMVLGGPLNNAMDRCGGSREQAEAMHARMKKRVVNESVLM